MMCSTWKISVFGIVALMLAFGLTAGDAFAHSDGHSNHPAAPRAVNHFDDATLTVTVNSSTASVTNDDGTLANQGYGGGYMDRADVALLGISEDNMLRATEVLDNVVFTYTPGRTRTAEKNIVLSIPGGWTRPEEDNDDGVHEPGEVEISSGTVTISGGRGGGWRVTSSNYKPAPTTPIVITYKRVTVPKRASSYKFGFVSNLVGGGHTNELDGHLLAHAQQVTEGTHKHRDSSLSVEVHTHTSSGIAEDEFSIAVHVHTEDSGIAPIIAHTHRTTPDTTDADDATEVYKAPEHAHEGADGALVAVFEHKHLGDNSGPVVEEEHMHAGDGDKVSTAPSHSHDADNTVTTINAHTHSPASSENATIAEHAHATATDDTATPDVDERENRSVDPHTHPDSDTSSSDAPDHQHSAVNEDYTRVPDHNHDSMAHELTLATLDLGPDHTHGAQNGAFPPDVVAHTHEAGDGTNTGNPNGETIPDHVHVISGGTASKVGTRTAPAGDTGATTTIASHVHRNATGSVIRPPDHTHAGGNGVSTRGNLHTHTDSSSAVGHVVNAHDHSDATAGNDPDPRHEHRFYTNGRAYALRTPSSHSHATATGAAGRPLHSHNGALTGAAIGPYQTPHDHDADDDGDFAGAGGAAGAAPFHAHSDYSDEDSPVIVIAAHIHTALVGAVSGPSGADGHTHSAFDAEADNILQAAVHKHTNGIASAAPYHTHDAEGVVSVAAHSHGTAFADSYGDSELPHHKHDDAAKPPILPVKDHSHSSVADRKGDPVHSHTEDYEEVDGTGNGHQHANHEEGQGPVSHSHTEGYVSIDAIAPHKHATADTGDGSPLHSHDPDFDVVNVAGPHNHSAENGIGQVGGLDHEHVSATGAVKVPAAHTHYDSVSNPNHVVQSDPHVHAYDDGSYIVGVGPAYSGSGMLTFSNTGTPRLAPEAAEDSPYIRRYLVTKGQSLGDLTLTYTAAGTMVKGAGIRILTNLPIDQGFYEYNRAGGPGGAVTLETRNAQFDADPVNSDADGYSADALYVKTTRALEAGNQVTFRVRNLKLKEHGKDADGKDPTLDVTDYTLEAFSASPLVMPMSTDTFVAEDLKLAGGAPIITVTAAHKTGETKLRGRDPQEDLAFATAGEDLKTLTFEYKSGVPMAIGSRVEITIPQGWTQPFEATSSSDARAGAVTLTGMADLRVDGMVLKATTIAELEGDPAPMLMFDYKGIKAPTTQDLYKFVTRTSAGPHARGILVELGAIDVDVTGSHAAGMVKLMRGSSVLRQVEKSQSLGNLRFVYTAAGRMAKGAQVQITIPLNWTSAHPETKDGRDAPGEVSIASGNADVEVTGGGGRPWKLTATTTAPLVAGNTIVFNYKTVTAPSTSGSYTFTTHATSFSGALSIDNIGARLDSSPTVGVDQAPDGAGTVALTSSLIDDLKKDSAGAYNVSAGEQLGNLVFTFTADGSMESGSVVTLTIPGSSTDWPDPTPDDGDGTASAGEVTAGGAGVVSAPSIVDRTITVDLSADLVSGNTFTITYKNISAPTTVDEYDFSMTSKSTTGGDPEPLTAGSPSIKVGPVRVGELTITRAVGGVDMPLTTAEPGEAVGNIKLTFTATSRMASGAQVIIDIPVGWSPPIEDDGDTAIREGEVELTSGAATHEVRGGKIFATTNADLAKGDTIVLTYKGVVAQSSPGSASFTTQASISATGTPVAIAQQPAPISVRVRVTGIAIDAEDSFFAGDDLAGMVTLWAGTSAASAASDMVIYLSTDSDTGSFASDSITIPAGMKGAAFTYNDTAPGTVMLRASDMMPAADDAEDTADTATALMDTHMVTVKSGVSGLVVDPTLVKAGSDISVSASGKTGGGTVSIMDSEGMQVGATKALDPVGDADADGNQAYARTVTLPAALDDGTYTVTISIQDLTDSKDIEVLNDQTPPALSNASVTAAGDGTFKNGAVVTVTASATSDIKGDISVMANVSALDDTRTDVALTKLTGTDIYTTIFTINDTNMAEDGDVDIVITATDRIKNSSMETVTVELDNVADDVLTSVDVEPAMAKAGETVWIKAMGSEGAEASATVNDSESGMMIAQVALDDEDSPGNYVGGLTIVEDAHPVGSYDVTVTLGNADPMTKEGALTVEVAGYTFTLSIPAGTHLIHVPLDVAQVDGVDMAIDTVGDLYDALGDAVNLLISRGTDGSLSWSEGTYLGDASAGTAADAAIGDSTGLIAVMNSAATLELSGNALGTGGVANIMLNAGDNLVGVPLDSAQISMISGVLGPLVSAVVVSNAAGDGFHTIAQAGDPGDGPLMGGVGYIVVAGATASIPVIGSAWQDAAMMAAGNGNGNGASAAPSVGFRTPVLQVQGKLIDEAGMMSREGLNVSVKNLTSGVVLGRETATTDTYSMTFVKLESNAAKIGDVLEIRADSLNPLLGIRPVQHVVTSEDVLDSRISLPDLVTYEIPAQTELLANYPNPFNPETWIPFRLAEDSNVSMDIYDASGSLVRNIDIGFTPAAVYEGRSDAIYWDGRNNFGEQVSSGIYFYHLNAGDFSATRKMVIVK